MSKKFGLVSRMSKIELPYLLSFINYYDKLGVEEFCFISTRPSENPLIKKFLEGFHNVTIIDKTGALMGCQTEGINHLTSEWVLSFDIDEFLMLPKHQTLNAFISSLPKNINFIAVRWIMAVNDLGCKNLPKSGVKGHTGKYIIKRKKIETLREHGAKMKVPKIIYETQCNEGYLAHYWCRSLNDMILKVIYHDFKGPKNSSLGHLLKSLNGGVIPNRLRILATLAKSPKPFRFHFHPLDINEKLEMELLREKITPRQHKRIKKMFKAYKSKLTRNHISLYPVGKRSLRSLPKMLPKR